MLKKQLEIKKGDLVLVSNMGYFPDFTGNSDLWGTIKKIFPKSGWFLIEFQTLFVGFTKFRECIEPSRIKRVFEGALT